jgi:hypothetical protein
MNRHRLISALSLGFTVYGAMYAYSQPLRLPQCGGNIICQCGDTVIADVTFTYNLACTGNGLTVGNHVTISGNGFGLWGTGQGIGLSYNGSHGSRVRDLFINGFDVNVLMSNGASDNFYENGWVWNGRNGVEVHPSAGSNNVLWSVYSFLNEQDGFRLDGAHDTIVAYSVAWSNETSIDLDRSTNNSIWLSQFYGDAGRAIGIREAHSDKLNWSEFHGGECHIDKTLADNTIQGVIATCRIVDDTGIFVK